MSAAPSARRAYDHHLREQVPRSGAKSGNRHLLGVIVRFRVVRFVRRPVPLALGELVRGIPDSAGAARASAEDRFHIRRDLRPRGPSLPRQREAEGVDRHFKRHFALTKTHPQQVSDKKHYVNYRDLHGTFPQSIPIPRAFRGLPDYLVLRSKTAIWHFSDALLEMRWSNLGASCGQPDGLPWLPPLPA